MESRMAQQHYAQTGPGYQWSSPMQQMQPLRYDSTPNTPALASSPTSTLSSSVSSPTSPFSMPFSPYISCPNASFSFPDPQQNASYSIEPKGQHQLPPMQAHGEDDVFSTTPRLSPLRSPYKAPPAMQHPRPSYSPYSTRLQFDDSAKKSVSSDSQDEDGMDDGSRQRMKGMRRSRLLSEKKRRDELRENLQMLHELLPETFCPAKMTKSKILERTALYLRSLERSHQKLEMRCEEYAAEVDGLRRQLHDNGLLAA